MLLTAVLVLATPLVALPPVHDGARVQKGVASVYWPGDGHSGPTCADGRPFTKDRCHIAHRFWPLGRRVRICSYKTGKCTTSFVGDRGPFGACDKKGMNPRTFVCRGRWFVKIRRRDPGTWRGIADLSRCVAKRLGRIRMQRVRLELLGPRHREKPRVALLTRRHAPLHTVRATRNKDKSRPRQGRPKLDVVVRGGSSWPRRGRNWPGVRWPSWAIIGPLFGEGWHFFVQHRQHLEVSTSR